MSGHIGAEIHGVDLRELTPGRWPPSGPRSCVEGRVLPRPAHHPEQHLAFGRAFGDLVPGHPTLLPAFPDYPEILLLDNQAGGAGGGNKPAAR